MRLSALLLLALTIGAAPAATIRTEAPQEESRAENRPEEEQPAPEDSDPQEGEKAPRRTTTQWSQLNPGQHPGSLRLIDGDDEDETLRPDWPPARYARRLPVAPVPPAPPADPPRPDVRAGHVSLPPPVA